MQVEQVDPTQVETPLPTEVVVDEPQAAVSVLDHAKQFGPNATKDEPEPDPLKPIRPVDQQNRDNGKFSEGKQRIKASEAVERINKLTARAKTAEEQRDAAQKELAALKANGGTRAEIKQAEQKVDRAEAKVEATSFDEPEPTEDDPKFEGQYDKFIRALAAWEGRKAYHDAQQSERQKQADAKRAAREQETGQAWAKRMTEASTKYQDFEQVALRTPARWLGQDGKPLPGAEAIDSFIVEDEQGPDVLYHLNKHPEEIDRLLGMTPTQQMRRLVAMATDLSPTAQTAGTTTAVAERKKPVILPTPPTVVRTEAQRTKDDPPPMDGSLSTAEHRKHFHKAR